ncbi:MAG: hypothetical protein PHN88_12180 [Ignavibacteria bacterium]|nr:hypothetical protein [Ignavibacteria bacterium]
MENESQNNTNLFLKIAKFDLSKKNFYKNPELKDFVNNSLTPVITDWALNSRYRFSLPDFLNSFGCPISFAFAVCHKFPLLKKALQLAIEATDTKIINAGLGTRKTVFFLKYYRKLYYDYITALYSNDAKPFYEDNFENPCFPLPEIDPIVKTIRLTTFS